VITIVDYGLGNIKAFVNVYKQLNIPVKIAHNNSDLIDTQKIILPGVGAFDHAISQLNNSGMRDELDNLVLHKKVPVLGICVGMQMLADSSDEGKLDGLGWIKGSVKKFDETNINFETHLPHMGWNDVVVAKDNKLNLGFGQNAKFYFLHSYYFNCNNAEDSILTANYGIDFTCGVNKNNIYGVQFHPEKSHQYGIQLLKNFANL